MSLSEHLLEEVFGVMFEYRIESVVMQVSMFISFVVVKIDEIFNIVMWTNVFDVLQMRIKVEWTDETGWSNNTLPLIIKIPYLSNTLKLMSMSLLGFN